MKHCLYLLFSLFLLSGAYGEKPRDPIFNELMERFVSTILKQKSPERVEQFSYKKEVIAKNSVLQLKTKNFTPGSKYSLYTVNTQFIRNFLGSYVANKNGELIAIRDSKSVAKAGESISMLALGVIGVAKGEASSYALYPEDGSTPLFVTYIESPIEYKWKDHAKFSMHLIDVSMYVILASGLTPDEEVMWTSENCGETVESEFTAGKEGTYISIFLPAVENKNGGKGKLTIYRKGTREVGSMTYYWGDECVKHGTNM